NPLGWLVGTQIALATTQVAVTASTTTVDAVDRLGQLKTAEDASLDFYSFVRSSYYQMRRAELREAVGLPSVVESPATSDLHDPEHAPAHASQPGAAAPYGRPHHITIVDRHMHRSKHQAGPFPWSVSCTCLSSALFTNSTESIAAPSWVRNCSIASFIGGGRSPHQLIA